MNQQTHSFISGEPSEDEPVCICVCGELADLQTEDYVTIPMIWCELCGGRYVVCPNCPSTKMEMKDFELIIADIIKSYEDLPKSEEEYQNAIKDLSAEESRFIWNKRCQRNNVWLKNVMDDIKLWTEIKRGNVMKVKKICTQQIYGKVWPESTKEDYILQRLKEKTIGELEEVEDPFDCEEDRFVIDHWLEIDCYDVEKHGIEGLDTSHDAILVFLECFCDKCQMVMKMHYWGD